MSFEYFVDPEDKSFTRAVFSHGVVNLKTFKIGREHIGRASFSASIKEWHHFRRRMDNIDRARYMELKLEHFLSKKS